MSELTVVCVKSKPEQGRADLYTRHDVLRLRDMVREYLTVPHRFYCFTDDAAGLNVPIRGLPAGLKGWWAKLALHRLGALSGRVLYLDLDTLIVSNLDFVNDYRGDFAILRDFYRPDGYGSGVMLWNKPQPQVWEHWERHHWCHPLGDQGIMEETCPGADRLQDVFPGKFVSYKVSCLQGPPEDAAVICFHGDPKPVHFSEDHWVSQAWNCRRMERATA